MKRMIRIGLMLLALVVASSAAAAPGSKQPKPTGMFSDMEYNEEGGDLLGTEVFITYAMMAISWSTNPVRANQ